MFGFARQNEVLNAQLHELNTENAQFNAIYNALNRSMAIIEFTPEGHVINANDNFLALSGYQLNEIISQHHDIFCSNEYVKTAEYQLFWQQLTQGECVNGQFERLTKNKQTMWLEASYNPIFDQENNLIKIVKFATDISLEVLKSQEQKSMVNAISRSMAVIEFNLDGIILTANENFLNTTQYRLDEVQGQHHQIFCEKTLVNSPEYKAFWQNLNRGEFQSGQYKRIDKHGNELWLEASYNPIFDDAGKLIKIVKFASNITARIQRANEAGIMASETSIKADSSAREGTDIVKSAVNSMASLSKDVTDASMSLKALNTQGDKINNIVNTISGIADQTNLLALNAAIEAARAGEQGRGFAVVADEVRQLAARTSSSTTEIAEVVKKNVELSAAATQSMKQSMEQISDSTEKITQLNSTIANTNEAISALGDAIKQFNCAV